SAALPAQQPGEEAIATGRLFMRRTRCSFPMVAGWCGVWRSTEDQLPSFQPTRQIGSGSEVQRGLAQRIQVVEGQAADSLHQFLVQRTELLLQNAHDQLALT